MGGALFLALLPSMALGAQRWSLDAMSNSTVAPDGTSAYLVQIQNVGDAFMDGSQIDLTATLAPGLTAVDATLADPLLGFAACTAGDGVSPVAGATTVRCSHTVPTPPRPLTGGNSFGNLQLTVRADAGVTPGATLVSTFDVAGGGADPVSTEKAMTVGELPEFGVNAMDGQVTADPAGNPMTQAGGHPYDASVSIDFNTLTNSLPIAGPIWPVEPIKDVIVDLPPGLVGDPTAVDQCTAAQLSNTILIGARPRCPVTSQVGTTMVRFNGFPFQESAAGPFPVFNMVPPPNAPARFGFNVFGSIVTLDAQLRSDDDYGITIVAADIPEAVPVSGTTVTLWGTPADPIHDAERTCSGDSPIADGGPTCRSGAPVKAFLRLPTSCTAGNGAQGLETTALVDSWKDPGDFKPASFVSHLPPAFPLPKDRWGREQGTKDCDRVPFIPTLRGTPVSRQAGKPSGFSFDLSMPQTDDPTVIAHSDLRDAVVTLPQGVRVSPSSAKGLAGCSPEQIGLDDRESASCPNGSKIGSLTIETPLLREPLQGGVYLAAPFNNPFNSLLAIYLVAEGPGLVVKLAGHVSPDASKGGQLTATFKDQPQLPFSNLHLEFKGGEGAPIAMPKKCGTYTTRAEMTGWSGRTVVSESSFTVDQNCTGGFTPGFDAGTTNPAGGKSSTFSLRLSRDDEDEELSKLTVEMPSGLTGRIADVPLCPDGNAAAGTCSDASKIGDVTVGAGAGSNPFYITNGRAYLTGPYGGAPFGLSVVVPAVAGPFDLGLVTVRQALFVDKHTAEIRVVSDAFPTILQGIPLDVRDVRVAINRPGFFLNPTSCAEKTIRGTVESTAGSKLGVSSRFQAANCATLPLRPTMTLQVGGRGSTQRGRTTPFVATLRQAPGQSALRFVQVTLPTTINARLTVINDACTRAEYEASKCEDARTGSATAVTPLLRDPLSGGVYFVRNGNPLPDLFVRLRGQVDFDLVGRITIPGSKRLRTTFDTVPDVPVSSFTLRLNGGREGSVGNAANLCSSRGRTAKAELDFRGQNGRVLQVDQRLQIRGCRARRARRGRGRRGRRR